jgi:hypothetical protein
MSGFEFAVLKPATRLLGSGRQRLCQRILGPYNRRAGVGQEPAAGVQAPPRRRDQSSETSVPAAAAVGRGLAAICDERRVGHDEVVMRRAVQPGPFHSLDPGETRSARTVMSDGAAAAGRSATRLMSTPAQ